MEDEQQTEDDADGSFMLDRVKRPIAITVRTAVSILASTAVMGLGLLGIVKSHVSEIENRFDRFDPLPYQIERIADDIGVLRGYYERYIGLDSEVKSLRAIQETIGRRVDRLEGLHDK